MFRRESSADRQAPDILRTPYVFSVSSNGHANPADREGTQMNNRPIAQCLTSAGLTVAAAFVSGSFLAPALAQARPILPAPTGCTTNGTPFPCPPPAPMPKLPLPSKPLQGPGVSWAPVLGGLVAHVTDRSGVASQCTYTADWYTRSFFLAAKGTYDVVMVPAIPKLGN